MTDDGKDSIEPRSGATRVAPSEQEIDAMHNDDAAQHGFVLIGNISSREFNFDKHGFAPHSEIEDAIIGALEEQGLYADGNTVGVSEMMHTLEEARDLIIRWTVAPEPEVGRVRGWVLKALLVVYRRVRWGARSSL